MAIYNGTLDVMNRAILKDKDAIEEVQNLCKASKTFADQIKITPDSITVSSDISVLLSEFGDDVFRGAWNLKEVIFSAFSDESRKYLLGGNITSGKQYVTLDGKDFSIQIERGASTKISFKENLSKFLPKFLNLLLPEQVSVLPRTIPMNVYFIVHDSVSNGKGKILINRKVVLKDMKESLKSIFETNCEFALGE